MEGVVEAVVMKTQEEQSHHEFELSSWDNAWQQTVYCFLPSGMSSHGHCQGSGGAKVCHIHIMFGDI